MTTKLTKATKLTLSRREIAEAKIHQLRSRLQKTTEISPRSVVELSSQALLGNYQSILEQVPGHALLPMVKANAYGHGAQWVVKTLMKCHDLYAFGVATLEEGQEVRTALGASGRKTRVIVFSETTPWTEEKGNYCKENSLTPVIATESDWNSFVKGGWTEKLDYELQFNTGMNRLGLPISFSSMIIRALKGKSSDHHPAGIFTHLASSEIHDSQLTQMQLEKYIQIRKELGTVFPGARFHLSNSGAIWNQKNFALGELTDVSRPGLSLYGVPPWPNAPMRGLTPVLQFKAQVIAVHRLRPGDSIGYGGTFSVKGGRSGDDSVYAAILGAGYADGVLRGLSNRGFAWLNGKPTRFLGTVSMDLCAIECQAGTQVGSWAELFGPHVDPWAQAQAAGTIPYEILTSLSSRVKRIYDPST